MQRRVESCGARRTLRIAAQTAAMLEVQLDTPLLRATSLDTNAQACTAPPCQVRLAAAQLRPALGT